MKKAVARFLLFVFYPLIVLVLFVKNYFTWIMLSLLLGSLIWFAMENYRLYTQGRGEYTSYLPSLFQRDRKGDKTVLHYMVFDLSRLTNGYGVPVVSAKRPAPKAQPTAPTESVEIPLFAEPVEPASEPEYEPVSEPASEPEYESDAGEALEK